MKTASALALLLISGCKTTHHVSALEARKPYWPHDCGYFRTTAGGAQSCNHPKASVAAGYATEAEIDIAVDAGFAFFWKTFPEFQGLRSAVVVHDDYVFFIPNTDTTAAGWTPAGRGSTIVVVALWSKGLSGVAPGACWISRAPGDYFGVTYSTWRYTKKPLLPALPHELLHVAIGDPSHTDPRWAKVGAHQ